MTDITKLQERLKFSTLAGDPITLDHIEAGHLYGTLSSQSDRIAEMKQELEAASEATRILFGKFMATKDGMNLQLESALAGARANAEPPNIPPATCQKEVCVPALTDAQEREAFEKWAALGDAGLETRLDLATHHGVYMDQDTRSAYRAWQARALLDAAAPVAVQPAQPQLRQMSAEELAEVRQYLDSWGCLAHSGVVELLEIAALAALPAAPVQPQNTFLIAAKAFAEAHIASDEIDKRDDGDDGSPPTDDEVEAADQRYNDTKRALVDAYKSLPAAPVQPQPDTQDARRYRLIRSMKDMTNDEAESVTDAMASVFPPDAEGAPTDAQFDAGVDAAIAQQPEQHPDHCHEDSGKPERAARGNQCGAERNKE